MKSVRIMAAGAVLALAVCSVWTRSSVSKWRRVGVLLAQAIASGQGYHLISAPTPELA
jgi:hypothetical protein